MRFCILVCYVFEAYFGSCRPKKTAEFLRDAVETRLRMLIPYIDTWPQVSLHYMPQKVISSIIICCPQTKCMCMSVFQAMSILILPHNIPHSLKHLSTLMDDIWYYAGDRSTDVSSLVCILATSCCPS